MNSDRIHGVARHTQWVLLSIKYGAWGSNLWSTMWVSSVCKVVETPSHPGDCHWEMS